MASSASRALQALTPLLILLILTSQHIGVFLPAHAAKVSSGHSSSSGTDSGGSEGTTSSSSSSGETDNGLGDVVGNLASNAIQSWEWALIIIAAIGEIVAVVLGLGAIKAIIVYTQKKGESRRRLGLAPDRLRDARWMPTDDAFWNTSGAFCLFVLVGLVSLAAYSPIFVLQQLMRTRVLTIGMDPFKTQDLMFGLANLTNSFGDIGVACALLAVVRRRWRIHFPKFSTSSTTGQPEYTQGWWYNWKLGFDAGIALLMVIVVAVIASLECREKTYFSLKKIIAFNDLYHFYSALYYCITIDVILSAFFLRGSLVKAGIKDDLVTKTLCLTASPFLGAQAIFWVINEVITSVPQTQPHINYDALAIAQVTIIFICYSYALLPVLRGFMEPGESFLSCGGPRTATADRH